MRVVQSAARLAAFGISLIGLVHSISAEEKTYGQARDFLAAHTKVLELKGDNGARVVVCPEYQGRVMTSTCDGLEGRSLGWINYKYIDEHKHDKQFNNYGGEDRFWLAPEGGQFSLWFAPGAKQVFATWFTPPALNEGAFRVISHDANPFYRLTRRTSLRNASGTDFDLEVVRQVNLLSGRQFGHYFGTAAKRLLDNSRTKMVGFETDNTLVNRGAPMKRATGLVSIWSLGMFPPGPKTEIIVPYKAGAEAELGPIVKADYFGPIPPERLHVAPGAVIFRGDGNYRSKIGISQKRARPVAGALDRQAGVLTLVHFTMPSEPAQHAYCNNAWDLPQQQPYVGDVLNSYNDGPTEPGKPALGGFFELETLSPAIELAPGQSLKHVHSTFHIVGDVKSLIAIANAALGVDLK